jgi:hypothetical protein
MGKRLPSGWYCPECGMTQAPGTGVITCRNCGSLGLRGYHRIWPQRVSCKEPGCAWRGWLDGVNPGMSDHLRTVHRIPQPCPGCKGTGLRRSKAKAAVAGRIACRQCRGAGKWLVWGIGPSPSPLSPRDTEEGSR